MTSIDSVNNYVGFLESLPVYKINLDDDIKKNEETLHTVVQDSHDFSDQLHIVVMQNYGDLVPRHKKVIKYFTLILLAKKLNVCLFKIQSLRIKFEVLNLADSVGRIPLVVQRRILHNLDPSLLMELLIVKNVIQYLIKSSMNSNMLNH